MKKLLILLVIFSSCSTSKLSDLQKKARKEKATVLGSMVVFGVGMKVIADKQTVIK